MGTPVAERILAAGFRLTVFNRTPERAASLVSRGARLAETPEDAARDADVCLTFVSDDAALEAVAAGSAGVLAHARPGSILIDMSTVSVAGSRRIASLADGAGVAYLRAPVSGNPGVVRAGNLVIIVSGPRDAFVRAEPLLRAIGRTIHHVGDAEQARVVKLALQVMIAGTAQLLSEALVLGELGGVDLATLLEVIEHSAVGSPFVSYKAGPLIAGDFSPTFATSMLAKDVALVLDFGKQTGASLPVSERLEELVHEAVDGGYAELDMMALYLRLRELSGLERVEVRAS